jgi:hypothetical protein
LAIDGRFDDCPHLHLENFRIGDREPASAMPQHRVRLVQLLHAPRHSLGRYPDFLGASSACLASSCGTNSCSGGSISRIVTGSPSIASKMPMKSRRWNGSSFIERLAPRLRVIREDHFLDRQLAVGALLGMLEILEEHVLGAAKPDSLGAHFARQAGVVRRVGIRANADFRCLSAHFIKVA